MIPDTRVKDCFKKQIMVDMFLLRPVLIGGGLIIIAPFLSQATPVSQVHIAALECVIMSAAMIFLQTYVLTTWEDQRLPFKMKDNKANYLFKRAKAAN